MDCPPSFESGGAGLAGTIDDYANFTTMPQQGGRYDEYQLLSQRTVKGMTNQILNDNQSKDFQKWHTLSGYSYGNLLRVITDNRQSGMITESGECGWDSWLGSYFANFPNKGLSVLIMMQKKDAGTSRLARI